MPIRKAMYGSIDDSSGDNKTHRDNSYLRAKAAMADRACLTASVFLCGFGFFKALRPSEAFLTEYLMEPPMNLTSEQLDGEVYPVWTYSYLVALIPVFLLSDVLRYKPVIIVEGACYIGTWALLLWARGVHAMRFMQFVYGFATATEIAYYAYPYAAVERHHYQKLTSYTRGFLLTGQFIGSGLGQLLISLDLCSYYDLNVISMTSVCIAFVIAWFLPSVQRTNYFHSIERTDTAVDGGHQAECDSIQETQSQTDEPDPRNEDVQIAESPISVISPGLEPVNPQEAETGPEAATGNEFWEDFSLKDGTGGDTALPKAGVEYNNPEHNQQRVFSDDGNEFWEDFNLDDGTGAITTELDDADSSRDPVVANQDQDVARIDHQEETTEAAAGHDQAVSTITPTNAPSTDFNDVDLSEDVVRDFASSLNNDDNQRSNSETIDTSSASSWQAPPNCVTLCCYRNFGPIWADFKECYGNKYLLKWSIWWAIATCGNMQVGNYVQILWEHIHPSTNDPETQAYNGAVEAASTLCGAIVVYLLILVHVNWKLFGELFLGVISTIDAILLISMAGTSYIWVAYVFYILFRASYQMVVTIASFQIASQLNVERYALVFGFNTFIALFLQTIITLIVVDDTVLGVPVTTQFIVTGCYFLLMGSIFLTIAVVLLTKIGWRTAWQQRKPDSYTQMEET